MAVILSLFELGDATKLNNLHCKVIYKTVAH